MQIVLIAKRGNMNTGVGKYVIYLQSALQQLGHQVTILHPSVLIPSSLNNILKKVVKIDLAAFFENYPLCIKYEKADLYHLTSQNLATLMLFCPPPGPTVITVHDIIPWLTRHDPELISYRHWVDAFFDWLAVTGLKHADAIITDSEFTHSTLISELENPVQYITTVYLGAL